MPRGNGVLAGLYETILDLIYPERGICFICDEFDEDMKSGHLCASCKEQLIFLEGSRCIICGRPLEMGYLPDKCPDCIQHTHYYTRVVSPLLYQGVIKEAIYKYKYGKKPYMYKLFGPLIVEALRKEEKQELDLIIPVPLHKSKLMDRGFNQSELLAKYISETTGVSLDVKNLIRAKKTNVQNKLGKAERLLNVKNAFMVKDGQAIYGKKILLVDDIFTTGATVNECSKVLLKAGAQEIIIATIATGIQK